MSRMHGFQNLVNERFCHVYSLHLGHFAVYAVCRTWDLIDTNDTHTKHMQSFAIAIIVIIYTAGS